MPATTPTPPHRDLRSLRRSRTREELANAALDLFEDQGYGDTSIEEIAGRVLLSPRTFYRYFPAKEDVVLWGMPAGDDGLSDLLADLADLPAADRVEQALMFVAERLESVADGRRKLALAAEVPHLQAQIVAADRRVEDILGDALGEREEGSPVDAQALAAAAVAVYRRAVERWVALGGGRRLATLVKRGLDTLRPSLEAGGG